jgi:hypothetical protein
LLSPSFFKVQNHIVPDGIPVRGARSAAIHQPELLVVRDLLLFAAQRQAFSARFHGRIDQYRQQLSSNPLPSEYRIHIQTEYALISAIRIMQRSIMVMGIADDRFIDDGSVHESNQYTLDFGNKEALREQLQPLAE